MTLDTLVIVSRVWVNSAAHSVLDRQVQLEGAGDNDVLAGEYTTIVGEHSRSLILILDVDRATLEEISVPLEDVGFGSLLHNRFGWHNQPIGPLLDWYQELHALAGLVFPGNEPVSFGRSCIANDFVW